MHRVEVALSQAVIQDAFDDRAEPAPNQVRDERINGIVAELVVISPVLVYDLAQLAREQALLIVQFAWV